jgi:hypothetical protein
MTGQGRGLCAGNTVPGSVNNSPGFGMGRGGRGGRGLRNRFGAAGFYAGETPTAVPSVPTDQQQEIAALKTAIGGLLTTLSEIQKRVEGIEAAPKTQ